MSRTRSLTWKKFISITVYFEKQQFCRQLFKYLNLIAVSLQFKIKIIEINQQLLFGGTFFIRYTKHKSMFEGMNNICLSFK